MQAFDFDYCDTYESYGSSGVMLENNGLRMFTCDECRGKKTFVKKVWMIQGLDARVAFKPRIRIRMNFKRRCPICPIRWFWRCRHRQLTPPQHHSFHGGGFNSSLNEEFEFDFRVNWKNAFHVALQFCGEVMRRVVLQVLNGWRLIFFAFQLRAFHCCRSLHFLFLFVLLLEKLHKFHKLLHTQHRHLQATTCILHRFHNSRIRIPFLWLGQCMRCQ